MSPYHDRLVAAVRYHVLSILDQGYSLDPVEESILTTEFIRPWVPLLTNPNEWLLEWKERYPVLFAQLLGHVALKGWDAVRESVHHWVEKQAQYMSMPLVEYLLAEVRNLEKEAILEEFGTLIDTSGGVTDARSPWRRAEERLSYLLTNFITHVPSQVMSVFEDGPIAAKSLGDEVLRQLAAHGLRLVVDPDLDRRYGKNLIR